jgi:hypothetical protein
MLLLQPVVQYYTNGGEAPNARSFWDAERRWSSKHGGGMEMAPFAIRREFPLFFDR